MKNVTIVSRGQEIGRTSFDSKTNTTKAKTFEPVIETDVNSNRANCLAILVHTFEQLVEADYKGAVVVRTLNLVLNPIYKLVSVKKTLASAGIEDQDKILEALFAGMNISEEEKEVWAKFMEYEEQLQVTYKRLPDEEEVVKLVESNSKFNQNLGLAIQEAWDRVPEIDGDGIVEDEAV